MSCGVVERCTPQPTHVCRCAANPTHWSRCPMCGICPDIFCGSVRVTVSGASVDCCIPIEVPLPAGGIEIHGHVSGTVEVPLIQMSESQCYWELNVAQSSIALCRVTDWSGDFNGPPFPPPVAGCVGT